MLKIENLHVSYGGIKALRGISLEVPDGKIVTLIGANGAGKSTTLRTISGLVKADGGSISYDGQELLGHHAYLKVKDNGIGIPLEDQSRIFERFYRVDKSHSRATGGTGLGLSIVKHAVKLSHGTIALESELNKGSTFTVAFPKA